MQAPVNVPKLPRPPSPFVTKTKKKLWDGRNNRLHILINAWPMSFFPFLRNIFNHCKMFRMFSPTVMKCPVRSAPHTGAIKVRKWAFLGSDQRECKQRVAHTARCKWSWGTCKSNQPFCVLFIHMCRWTLLPFISATIPTLLLTPEETG